MIDHCLAVVKRSVPENSLRSDIFNVPITPPPPIYNRNVINKNKRPWFGHVTRRKEESTPRVVMKEVKDEGKENKRKTTAKVAR